MDLSLNDQAAFLARCVFTAHNLVKTDPIYYSNPMFVRVLCGPTDEIVVECRDNWTLSDTVEKCLLSLRLFWGSSYVWCVLCRTKDSSIYVHPQDGCEWFSSLLPVDDPTWTLGMALEHKAEEGQCSIEDLVLVPCIPYKIQARMIGFSNIIKETNIESYLPYFFSMEDAEEMIIENYSQPFCIQKMRVEWIDNCLHICLNCTKLVSVEECVNVYASKEFPPRQLIPMTFHYSTRCGEIKAHISDKIGVRRSLLRLYCDNQLVDTPNWLPIHHIFDSKKVYVWVVDQEESLTCICSLYPLPPLLPQNLWKFYIQQTYHIARKWKKQEEDPNYPSNIFHLLFYWLQLEYCKHLL